MSYPELVKLEGTVRDLSRKSTKELRENSKVPAVLYGPEIEENLHFSIDEIEIEKILKKKETKLQELTIDGKVYKTLLKRVEFHPVSDKPLHADFYVLADKHKVTLRVPIKLKGTAKGIVEQGGRLFQPMNFMRIRVFPANIPSEFEVDISDMNIGDSVHVSDLDLGDIIPIDSLSRTIVNIRPPKGALVTAQDELEAEEGLEGTEEGAEGTEASGGDDSSAEESNE